LGSFYRIYFNAPDLSLGKKLGKKYEKSVFTMGYLLTPAFAGPVGIIMLLVLYHQHKDVERRNKEKFFWEKKEKSLVDMARLPLELPLMGEKPKTLFEKSKDIIWWNVTHPYILFSEREIKFCLE
jgi:hypothetical protein